MGRLVEVYEANGDIESAIRETENAGRLIRALETDPRIGAFGGYLTTIEEAKKRLTNG